jgi:methyl-accepting chemotaxis protein
MSDEARQAARLMQAASEEATSAARQLRSAAEEITQAARNLDGAVDRAQMLWERQIMPDLTALVERMEAASKGGTDGN